MVDKIGVHTSHCCKTHGCKYNNKDCPVVNGDIVQLYPCEECGYDADKLRVYTNNSFEGYWPVGSAAVVVAKNITEACELLSEELQCMGLEPVKIESMQELDMSRVGVEILCDGNY